jgi:hypothetical protein
LRAGDGRWRRGGERRRTASDWLQCRRRTGAAGVARATQGGGGMVARVADGGGAVSRVADGGARTAAHGRRSGGGDVGEDEEAAENEQAAVEWARE